MGYENSGRRVSTAVKALRGNPGKRRLDPPVMVSPGPVHKPTGLSPGAGVVWDELAPVCRHMGTLTASDARPFRMLCELQATLDLAATWKAEGRYDEAFSLEKRFAAVIRGYYALFGLDPVSRSQIVVPPAEAEGKWAAIA